ncbi:MAG: excinuclease ABC subunit UvrA [Akkermansiaceae bacterium]|nr:excinuclease ABC subunit UvrA [Akkermansiaceae bacterium]MDG1365074.1 excinuclease ABC subunit UvrA [Akkermansiaceae bacterium]
MAEPATNCGVIRIRGARQHNLKGLDVDLPRGKMIAITGVSGSGKSSLAFHTLYAEGQRRYVESLSVYARQFLDQLEKPEVDSIEGLSPAIAIEQRTGAGNPRSTIATVTEIHDFLRILYAAVGVPHDPETGEELMRMSTADIVKSLSNRPEGSRVILLAPITTEGDSKGMISDLQRQGFVRVRVKGEVIELEAAEEVWPEDGGEIEIVVDRLVVKEGVDSRMADSVEIAIRICGLEVRALAQARGSDHWEELAFATSYRNAKTGFELPLLTPKHFSFNSHLGACEVCHGLGTEAFCNPFLVVPDPSKSLAEGAVAVWSKVSKKKKGWNQLHIEALASFFGVSLNERFDSFPENFKRALFYGTGDTKIEVPWEKDGATVSWKKEFEGICKQVERLYRETESDGVKRSMGRFMTSRECKVCKGKRLKKEYLAVTLKGKDGAKGIDELCSTPIGEALDWVGTVEGFADRQVAMKGVLAELEKRLSFLDEVGLGYLALDRASGTLSGGEIQRVRLATQLGAGLAGVLYVLDEPSVGLHPLDNERLIQALQRLRDSGNTVVVVEHDEAMVKAADQVVEIGPAAGKHGGELVAQGTPAEIAKLDTPTGCWLRRGVPMVNSRKRKSAFELTIKGPRENNLKGEDVTIPLGQLVGVTGPSGSGKSTLVDRVLRRALARKFHRAKDEPGKHEGIEGLEYVEKVVIVDQSPLGKSPRSNPATYTGAFDLVRDLFSQLPLSRQRGYKAGRFSFNVKGGRCEKCQGGGSIRIDMHFLPDVWIECEACQGHRYNRETLDVRYRGKSVADILEMTIEEGREFFGAVPRLSVIMNTLFDVGLGYVRLGQAANTLSGGEAQRVKLACELSKSAPGHTLYLLDEPTTGLHYQDVQVLLEALLKLRDAGHSLVVVEHNLDVISVCDHIIDLGPTGGVGGGNIVATGTPAEVRKSEKSLTGQALRDFTS